MMVVLDRCVSIVRYHYKIFGGFIMRSKLKKIFNSILMVAILSVAIEGCTSKDVTSEERSTKDNIVTAKPKESKMLSEGAVVPDFTAETVDGNTFNLSDQKGKVVLLNFWATWCGPCVGEMPAFERLYNEYGEKVSILAVNCEEDKNTVSQFISDSGYTFPVAYDVDGDISTQYSTSGIPYTLVIGKDGLIKKIFLGADSDADVQYNEYKKAIDAILEE